ncbi:MAG: response regulator [Desulfovibrio sp.]
MILLQEKLNSASKIHPGIKSISILQRNPLGAYTWLAGAQKGQPLGNANFGRHGFVAPKDQQNAPYITDDIRDERGWSRKGYLTIYSNSESPIGMVALVVSTQNIHEKITVTQSLILAGWFFAITIILSAGVVFHRRDLERAASQPILSIKEDKQQAEAQRQDAELFRAILDRIDTGVCLLRHDRITYTNNALTTLLGLGNSELIGQFITDYIHRTGTMSNAQNNFESRPMEYPATINTCSGESCNVRVSVSPFYGQEPPLTLLSIYPEQQFVFTEGQPEVPIESTLQSGRHNYLLASLSHDLRTPLNAIKGSVDLLCETELSPSQTAYVNTFKQATSNLTQLLEDMLDLTQEDAGQLTLQKKSFNLIDEIERTCGVMSIDAYMKGINFSISFSPKVPPFVIGDPKRLNQILANLISNAVKYTDSGAIMVSVHPVESDKKNVTIGISVSDSGIGISPEQQESIFSRYKQLSDQSGAPRKGRGLGLSICKMLTTKMNGTISAFSKQGAGSTFSFTAQLQLPAHTNALPEVFRHNFQISESLHHKLEGQPVLIIDDVRMDQKVLEDLFSEQGAHPHTFSSGQELIWELESNSAITKSPLIFLSANIANEDSLSTALSLRKACPQAKIIFICLPHLIEKQMHSAIQIGMKDALSKPLRRTDISAVLNKAFASAAAEVKEMRPMRILIAEDSEFNRFVIENYLKDSPHTLLFAVDGKDACDQFKPGIFDLIIMDIEMPVMNGLDATQHIRDKEKRCSAKPTPIIAVTGYTSSDRIDTILTAGCNEHLAKPINKQALLNMLQRYA